MTFDELISGGLDGLHNLVTEKLEETYQLEFKQKQDPSALELHKDDRRALGEALSGFANAVGGVLVIGIRTERPNGIDRATHFIPIGDAKVVADRYRSYINDCVSPQLEGVRVSPLVDADGSGAIVIEIPRGQARPHMSMAPSHQRYYRRVADGFLPMLHYEIDEMMRLKSQPKLKLIHRLQQQGNIGGNNQYQILFGLENTSNATAKFPFISYIQRPNQPSVAEYGLDGNGNTLWKRIAAGASTGTTFSAGADQVIHPGQSFFISKIDFVETYEPRFRDWGVSNLAEGERLILEFEFGCEDCPKDRQTISFERMELLGAE